MQQARKRREAVEAIEELGGAVMYDYEWVSMKPPGPAWLVELLGIDFLADVAHVSWPGEAALCANMSETTAS